MASPTFGTDGIRGRFGSDLTVALAEKLARCAGVVLDGSTAFIGRDTRESGPVLTSALARGFRTAGIEPIDIGIAPTPAVAYLAAKQGAIGAVVSASHNPAHDNGIKLFTRSGNKLADHEQAAIESLLAEHDPQFAGDDSAPGGVEPRLEADPNLISSWVHALRDTVEQDLSGLAVVVDAANGAGSHVVGPLLADLGIDVTMLHNQPDGVNINHKCGSTSPASLADAVVQRNADLGIALDGDADRLVAVDNTGTLIDGDHLMAMLAVDMRDRGTLAGDTLVTTVMSNLGLHKAMQREGISVVVTPVGDRWVLDALRSNGWSFGGEQSGHLIFADLAHTGDGTLAMLQLLEAMVRSDSDLATLATSAMTSFPQVLRNVAIATSGVNLDDLADEVTKAEVALGDDGRVLVRASGTEPVIRVMVEATSVDEADRWCNALCDAVQTCFG